MTHPRWLSCGSVAWLLLVLWFGVTGHSQEEVADEGAFASIDSSVTLVLTSIASKKEESISDAPGVISIITHDELERFGGTTLADILKRVPSFLGSTIYMTDRSVIASRGDQFIPSSSHILLLLNGRPMREVMEGGIKSEVYESFPVSVIDRIEVIRGPGSVLYGSQAVSAVINVITKNPENNTVTVSGALGEGLRNNVSADIQYQLGDFGVVLAGRYADKGGWNVNWEAPGLATIYTNSVSIPDFGPGAYAELSFKDLRLMCSYNQWRTQYFVPDIQWFRDVPEIGVSDATGQIGWKKIFGDLGYKFKPTDWYTTTANITCTRSWLETYGFPSTYRDAFELLGEWTNFISPVKRLNITIGGTLGLLTGTERDMKRNPLAYHGGIYNKGHIATIFCGYTQADYRLEWLKLIGGVQANKVRVTDTLGKVDDFKPDFNPRLGLILYPLEHFNIKTLFSMAYRAPSLDELYLDYQTISGKMVPNDDIVWEPGHEYSLDPEKVQTFDVGINYQDNKIRFGINGFHSWMKNLIVQRAVSGSGPSLVWDNLGEVILFGIECEGTYYVTKALFFEGSFLFQQSRDYISGEFDIAPLPNFSVKCGLSYRSEFGLTIGVLNTFRQALDKKYWSELNVTTKYFNMANIHCSYDLNRLLKSTRAKELSILFDIDNLLNEEVWLPPQGSENGSMVPYNHGRTIYGGFKVAF